MKGFEKKIPGNKTEKHNKPFSLFHTGQPFTGHILVTEAKRQPGVVFEDMTGEPEAYIQILPPLCPSWVTFGKFLTSLSLGFHICKMRIIKELS